MAAPYSGKNRLVREQLFLSLERIFFRLSRSAYHDVFVFKGALLFELWSGQQYRPTRDAAYLGRGENSPERFFRIFRELCSVETEPDGLRFDPGKRPALQKGSPQTARTGFVSTPKFSVRDGQPVYL
jgi:hypothetical protein